MTDIRKNIESFLFFDLSKKMTAYEAAKKEWSRNIVHINTGYRNEIDEIISITKLFLHKRFINDKHSLIKKIHTHPSMNSSQNVSHIKKKFK